MTHKIAVLKIFFFVARAKIGPARAKTDPRVFSRTVYPIWLKFWGMVEGTNTEGFDWGIIDWTIIFNIIQIFLILKKKSPNGPAKKFITDKKICFSKKSYVPVSVFVPFIIPQNLSQIGQAVVEISREWFLKSTKTTFWDIGQNVGRRTYPKCLLSP